MTESITLGLIIETRFLGPTDTRGSRISAVCKRDSDRTYRKTINWRHDLNPTDNHQSAAQALVDVIDAELGFTDCQHFRIVGRGCGGSNDASYYWLVNRGGA